MFCRKAFCLAGLTLCTIVSCFSQIVISAQNGYWHDPSTWMDGVVPSSVNCTLVRIAHSVQVATPVSAPSLEINNALHIDPAGDLDLLPPPGGGTVHVADAGILRVEGTLRAGDSVTYTGQHNRIIFDDGSRFHYVGGYRGYLPLATWHPESELLINGFIGSGYIAIAYSESWKQHFGHVIYDCPGQPSFVDLNGYLSSIQGDLIIRNTNNQTLRLSTTQRPVISIGGNFRIEGPSEVWMTTTSDSARVHVGGDFEYYSTSTGPSYFATRGRCYMEVQGHLRMDASGPLRLFSGSADSTGVRNTTITLHKGMTVTRGSFIAPSPGMGMIVFTGPEEQVVATMPNTFSGNIHFHVDPACTVDLRESIVVTSGNLVVRGHVKAGSPDPDGALQPGGSGNFQTSGTITFSAGSALEYNGVVPQVVGSLTPTDHRVDVIINNTNGVTLAGDMVVRSLNIENGSLNLNGNAVIAAADVSATPGRSLTNGDIILIGDGSATLAIHGGTLRDLILDKESGVAVDITAPVSVSRNVLIRGANTLRSNGFLTLASTSDAPGGTAAVLPLPSGSAIEGAVVVQRFMSGEGRLYRYIASPVESASVASLQKSFPVTGTFTDPSRGPGISSTSPSLYYYEGGWKPFPGAGYAAANILEPGRGYAAFVRGNSSPVVLHFEGPLNQGPINLPVVYDESDEEHTGWNLVGNPYAAAIDWNLDEGWTRSSNIGLVFAVRDNAEGRFRYSDGEVGDANGGVIASGQAFWVHARSSEPELLVHEAAKVSEDVTFFRSRTETDFIRISVEGNGNRDELHIRKRRNSKRGLDLGDAIKRWNDKLTLSVLSADGVPLALSAVDTISCDEVYQLLISYPPDTSHKPQSLPPGTYTLHTEGHGRFGTSDLLIVDTFTGDTIDAPVYNFSVGNSEESKAINRFKLLVRSRPVERPFVEVGELACGDSVVHLRIDQRENGVQYVAAVGGDEYPFDAYGRAKIPIDTLASALTISVNARSVCHESSKVVTIHPRRIPEPPRVEDQIRCVSGPVTFTVLNSSPGLKWYWYEKNLQEDQVHISPSASFQTGHLDKSTSWVVVAENEFGCRSAAVYADARIINADTFHVWEEVGLFISSFPETEWYGPDGLLHKGSSFDPGDAGPFVAEIRIGNCVFRKEVSVERSLYVDMYPIPFEHELQIQSPYPIEQIEVYDGRGRLVTRHVERKTVCRIPTGNWGSGVYLVKIVINSAEIVRRIVRR